jgi:hypothetical protein
LSFLSLLPSYLSFLSFLLTLSFHTIPCPSFLPFFPSFSPCPSLPFLPPFFLTLPCLSFLTLPCLSFLTFPSFLLSFLSFLSFLPSSYLSFLSSPSPPSFLPSFQEPAVSSNPWLEVVSRNRQ